MALFSYLDDPNPNIPPKTLLSIDGPHHNLGMFAGTDDPKWVIQNGNQIIRDSTLHYVGGDGKTVWMATLHAEWDSNRSRCHVWLSNEAGYGKKNDDSNDIVITFSDTVPRRVSVSDYVVSDQEVTIYIRPV